MDVLNEKPLFSSPVVIGSKILSFAFHPLLMPTLGVFILFQLGNSVFLADWRLQLNVVGFVFLTTFMLPLSMLPILYYSGLVSGIYLKSRMERFLPFLFTSVFFFFSFFRLARLNVPMFVKIFSLSAAIAVTFITALSLRWKISAHTTGLGGLLGLLSALVFVMQIDAILLFSLLTFLTGLVASARLILKAHTPFEVYAGFALGFVTQFFVFLIFT